MSQQYSELVCLVGENPLPVYLGIRQFAASDATIVLVHTGQNGTEPIASKIRAHVRDDAKQRGVNLTVKKELLDDPHCPQTVRTKMEQLKRDLPNAALNYTGGTKVMAGYALLVWKDSLEKTFYLEEADKLFHIGAAMETEALSVPLTVNNLCRLHSVDEFKKEVFTDCTRQDLALLWEAHLRNEFRDLYLIAAGHRYSNDQYRWLVTQYDAAAQMWRQDTDWFAFISTLTPETQRSCLETSLPHYRDYHDEEDPTNDSDLYRLYRFATGVWLEQLMHIIVQEASPQTEFLYGQHFTVSGQEFESDIVAVNNHRLRYISVSSSGGGGQARTFKGKMFEAIHRAQQLGGGLAQSCLVCPADRDMVASVQKSIGHRSRHKIYGRDDVANWISRDYTSLREFLEN